MEYNIEVENLTKKYENFELQNVSFKLPKGCIMGFIGENGAGKTTTLSLILNTIKKDCGNIKIFDMDNIKFEKQIKQNIGVVFDESLFPDNLKLKDISTIMKNVFKNWDNSVFLNYSNKFKLPSDKIIKQYSKGMKMKLSIAVALSHNSKLLILDEATSGLDPIIRDEILDVFLEFIQDEEKSILLSSHITSDLEKIADYITFIHEGKVIFSESKDDLIYQYGILKCGLEDIKNISADDIVGQRKNQFGYEILVKDRDSMHKKYKNLIIDNVSLEDIMLFYVKDKNI